MIHRMDEHLVFPRRVFMMRMISLMIMDKLVRGIPLMIIIINPMSIQ